MSSHQSTWRRLFAGLAVVGLLLTVWPAMADRPRLRPARNRAPAVQEAPATPIGLFRAIGNRQATATVAAHGLSQCTVWLTNNTNRPLELTLPDVFAAAPLASEGPSQTLGSGFPYHLVNAGAPGAPIAQPPAAAPPAAVAEPLPARRFTPPPAEARQWYVRYGANMWVHRQDAPNAFANPAPRQAPGGGGQPAAPARAPNGATIVAGTLSLEPHATRHMDVVSVCLEESKASPRANARYRLIPLQQFTRNTEVHEVCRLLAQGALDQGTAQQAAWDLLAGGPLAPETTAAIRAARAKVQSGAVENSKNGSLSQY